METNKLSNAIHMAIFNINIKKIKKIKDFYIKATSDIDISKISLDEIKERKELFEWMLDNLDYDYNGLFDNYYLNHERYNYTNKDFTNFFQVYYQKLKFIIDRYEKGEFVIKLKDLG